MLTFTLHCPTLVSTNMEKAVKKKKKEQGKFLLTSNLDNGMLKWHPTARLHLIYVHIVLILLLVRADKLTYLMNGTNFFLLM